MQTQTFRAPVCLLVFLFSCAAPGTEVSTGFRAGVASTDITPVLGTPMAGYYHARGADGILDPLFSKAVVIESAGERLALVTLDLISVTREITDQSRTEIERATGIRGDHVMISATHAHTGPELAGQGKRVENLGGSSKLALERVLRKLKAASSVLLGFFEISEIASTRAIFGTSRPLPGQLLGQQCLEKIIRGRSFQ